MPEVFCVDRTLHRHTADDTDHPLYREIRVWCPGCEGIHHFTVEILDPNYTRPNGSPEPVWGWDGNMERPTFSPSMLAYSTVHLCPADYDHYEVCEFPTQCVQPGHAILNAERYGETPPPDARILGHNKPHVVDPAWGNCHSFLKAGVWEFLSDSAHSLAGQSVPMVPIPEKVLSQGWI